MRDCGGRVMAAAAGPLPGRGREAARTQSGGQGRSAPRRAGNASGWARVERVKVLPRSWFPRVRGLKAALTRPRRLFLCQTWRLPRLLSSPRPLFRVSANPALFKRPPPFRAADRRDVVYFFFSRIGNEREEGKT